MLRQNRVTPFGEFIAVDARGTLMGNRGCLREATGVIRRARQGKRWIICALSFKGRRLPLMAPGHYTQLFFLDEATALAAVHRPCAECQLARFELFRAAWVRGNPSLARSNRPTAVEIDGVLDAERIGRDGKRVTYAAALDRLPDGCFIRLEGDTAAAYLALGDRLLRWSAWGYDRAERRPLELTVQVLTPRSTVAALAAGYTPSLHESAHAAPAQEG